MVSKLEYVPCEYDTVPVCVCARAPLATARPCARKREGSSDGLSRDSSSRAEEGGKSGIFNLGF